MPDSQDPIACMADELAQLRDLFQRRLLTDRAKQQLYDELYAQLEFTRSNLVTQFLAPFAREMLLVIDRIESNLAAPEPSETNEISSVAQELVEILNRRGLRCIESTGALFDPRIHEAVEREPVDLIDDHDRVLRQRRPGFFLGDCLLRPAQVIVGHHTAKVEAHPDGVSY